MCLQGAPGHKPFDPNSLSNEEYFEWLNKQPISKKEYYKLFFARLKPNRSKLEILNSLKRKK